MSGRGLFSAFALACAVVVLAAMASGASAAFPGENGRIAFDEHCDIWVTSDGSRVATSITDGLPSYCSRAHSFPAFAENPSFSDDGTRIAFSRYVARPAVSSDIYVMNADGGNLAQVTDGIWAKQPSFSPDGTIVFVRWGVDDGDRDIYSVSEDGSDLTPLLTGPTRDLEPSVSPDGRQITFMREAPDPNYDEEADVYVMNADGSDVKKVVDSRGVNTYVADVWPRPSFSPDGQRIVYTDRGRVWTVGVDGSDPHPQFGSVLRPYAETALMSPDGNRILTAAYDEWAEPGGLVYRRDLHTRALDGTQLVNLTVPNGAQEGLDGPDWAPAGAEEPSEAECRGRSASLVGTLHMDTVDGTSGRDVIAGGGGEDTADGRAGNDLICAGSGPDRVDGGGGDDKLVAGRGRDKVDGGSGRDKLVGLGGNDRLRGGPGPDFLRGGPGRDVCNGGPGRDRATASCDVVRNATRP